MPQGKVYEWAIDGRVDSSSLEATFTTRFTPAATINDRRKNYKVSVCVGSYTAETIVRVAQHVNVGTTNITQSNKGMDTLGWTDTTPVEFDTTLTADEDIVLQNQFCLTRPVRSQKLPDGRTQYGRLQYSKVASNMDMTTTGLPYRKAALVITHPRAFRWNREEFEAMLAHELIHCKHRIETTDSSSIWKKFLDQNQSLFLRLTETIAYFEYIQSQTVSYKFLRDNNVFFVFIKNYNLAQKDMLSLNGTIKTQAKAILQKCYDEAQYFELREPREVLEKWDYHIEPPL